MATGSAVTGSTGTDAMSGSLAVAAQAGPLARHGPSGLGVFDEPVELLVELRAAARDRPAAARASAPGLLALHAVEAWGEQLDALGVPVSLVTHAFETCRREIWLWVEGDRRWQQLAGHLAQRVVRRAQVATASAVPPRDNAIQAVTATT